ncbi:MAG TPA: hypothetical protein VEB42_12035 [Chitinophagaceae bacterium]|nr:hypothetical protein [Chitinophagaceae bacterium]
MARQYPRFLFSDPQNTKSKGPFIVYTLHPRIIFKLFFPKDGEPVPENSVVSPLAGLTLLDKIEFTENIHDIAVDALIWFEKQIDEGSLGISRGRLIATLINRK